MQLIERETSTNQPASKEPITRLFARHVATLDYEKLPAAVISKAKELIRDGLGNQLAASVIAEPARRMVELLVEWGGKPEATIVGYGAKVPLPHAVMANAMMGHGVELDDAHGRALTKAGSSMVPAAVAIGAFAHRSGKEMLAAVVAGYDIAIRLGVAINPSHRHRGYHTSGTVGTFGVASAGARLLGLDAETTASAIGLAGIQAAGIQGYLDDPCMAKPFSPGKAGFNGTLAAILASRGFTGPKTMLESNEGFLNAYADEFDEAVLIHGLGTDFKVMEVGFKPHAACRYAHGPIDCAQTIFANEGAVESEIVAVTVWMSELSIRQSGRSEVSNLNAAMGSTPFGVALAILTGRNGLADYRTGFDDRRTHELAARVKLIADPAIGHMGRAARVTVEYADGRSETVAVGGPRGEPEFPLSAEELHAKYLSMATVAIPESQALELEDTIMHLEDVADITVIPPLTVSSSLPTAERH
jgi:2-methylcitrate dehydratase PrpD